MCKITETVFFTDETNLFSSGSNAISLQDGANNDGYHCWIAES